MVAITLVVRDYVTAQPQPGLSVSACAPADVTCTSPSAAGSTDATGTVVLSLPLLPLSGAGGQGPGGYLQVTSPTIVPTLVYWGFPLAESALSLQTYVLTPAEQQSTLQAEGVTLDANRGQITAQVMDCRLHRAPVVAVTASTSDALTRSLYGSTGATSTDSTGTVTFVNVPPGVTSLTATPLAEGRPSTQVAVDVRPGTITQVTMVPTP
jgi:hypothetical protein